MGEGSIRVNMSDVGEGSGIRDPLPSGKYHVKVTDGELKEAGENAKNPGSEYISWEFTVQDGEYEDRKVWSNTSLLPQARFALKGLLEAVGQDAGGEVAFDIDDLIGEDLIVQVKKMPKRTNQETGEEYDERNDIKGYGKYDPNAPVPGAAKAKNPLMP
jgi:hypothetical protein